MTRRFVFLLLALVAITPGLIATTPPPSTSEAVVQGQVDAYNTHNLGAFVASYADDAQIFEHPSKLLASGSAQIRELYQSGFKANLHAEIVNRVVMGNRVVDHERVTRTSPQGGHALSDAVVIYEVQNGKIAKAWLITGPKTMTPKPTASTP